MPPRVGSPASAFPQHIGAPHPPVTSPQMGVDLGRRTGSACRREGRSERQWLEPGAYRPDVMTSISHAP